MRLAPFDEHENLLPGIGDGWEGFIGGNLFNLEAAPCIWQIP
jgi:hypothetical protein